MADTPKRIQRRRTKGYRLPEGAVIEQPHLILNLGELAGKDLACFCPLPAEGEPDRCHAALLLSLANGDPDA
ncbi:DUF4326 domain-containing protein [Nonomuraea sp. CA-218870]|uniref:DUF4326 domain-containing protein n=1 Tax=Nonomuraea sp. CA-218870 TaxID=3239998 RepID=UPI003D8E0867